MVEQQTDAEARFAAIIDCRFPYLDEEAASALIEEGWALSTDAAFGVLHEICRKPKYAKVTQKRQFELVDEWLAQGSHPLQNSIAECARVLIGNGQMPWQRAIAVMDEVAEFPRQYAALNIAYLAGDSDSSEGEAQLEASHNRITLARA